VQALADGFEAFVEVLVFGNSARLATINWLAMSPP
jgi:hypothetical protein